MPARRCGATVPSGSPISTSGTPGCQAEALLDFLRSVDCATLFLVGDIVDGWQLRRNWYWLQARNDVVQKLLRKVRKGTRVVFVP